MAVMTGSGVKMGAGVVGGCATGSGARVTSGTTVVGSGTTVAGMVATRRRLRVVVETRAGRVVAGTTAATVVGTGRVVGAGATVVGGAVVGATVVVGARLVVVDGMDVVVAAAMVRDGRRRDRGRRDGRRRDRDRDRCRRGAERLGLHLMHNEDGEGKQTAHHGHRGGGSPPTGDPGEAVALPAIVR